MWAENKYVIPKAARCKNRAAVWIERFLWIAGCLALGYCAFIWGRSQYDQAQGRWALENPVASDLRARSTTRVNPEGTLVGRIDIPKLDLSAVVFEGTSDETLARGVGHLTGSAGSGERGNLVLAGHRDTFFRKLRGIRKGDEVTIKGPEGEFQYQVESTAVVKPDQTEVLKPDGGSILTLITCYPFRFIGNAPDRFVVRARKIDTSAANKSRNSS